MGTDNAWRRWGDIDPYFAVLTDERFRRGNIGVNRAEFFESGRRDVDATLSRYRRMLGELPTGSALDFGCGVGRLSLALAERFDRVLGLDISPGMLAEAQGNAKAHGRSNASFAIADADLSSAQGQFDFVNSYIVLQHIPTSRGLPIIEKLLAKVAPGGGCMLHVSIQRASSLPRRLAFWMRSSVPLVGRLLNAAGGRPAGDPVMQMNEYPLPRIISMFQAAGMGELVCVPEMHGVVLTLCISGRRPT